jgi:hypothetical protein
VPAPLVPGREARRRAVERFAPVELPGRRDADGGRPPGELLVGHVPRRVRFLGVAPVETSSLLGRWEREIVQLGRRTAVDGRLPQRGPLVACPEAEVEDDVDSQLQCAQATRPS